jgi:hypothetical protein
MSGIDVLIGGTGISFGSGRSGIPDPAVCPPTAHASTPTASTATPFRTNLIAAFLRLTRSLISLDSLISLFHFFT